MFFSLLSALGIFVCSVILGIRIERLRTEKQRMLIGIMQETLGDWQDFLEENYTKQELDSLMEKFQEFNLRHQK